MLTASRASLKFSVKFRKKSMLGQKCRKSRFLVKNDDKVDFWSKLSKKSIFSQKYRKRPFLVNQCRKCQFWVKKCRKSRLVVRNVKQSIIRKNIEKSIESRFLVINIEKVLFWSKMSKDVVKFDFCSKISKMSMFGLIYRES